MTLTEQFKLDKIDKDIITLLQSDPSITHSKIAKKIGRSQPAVGSRIRRLEEKGVISSKFGVNFKNIDIYLVKVELETSRPDEVFKMGEHCPFVINVMRLSGQNNIMIFLASGSLKKIDLVIDYHFRNKNYIKNVKMDVISGFLKDFILPIDFEMDNHEPEPGVGCSNCRALLDER